MHVITHFNAFITGKIEKLDFWDANKNINPRTTRAKSINLHTIRKLIEYSLKNVLVKAIFTPSVFEILMHEGRSVLTAAQRGTRNEGVKVSVKKQKNILNLLKLLEKWLTYKLRRFSMVFNFFLILFNPFITGKIEKLDFWDANNSTNFKHQ